ncbi:MAG: nucleotidyltransferase family protein [Christensenellales bacterium]
MAKELKCSTLRLIGKMNDAGIPALLIKGYAVADCYAAPDCRMSGDTDLLIEPKNEKRACAFMKANDPPPSLINLIEHLSALKRTFVLSSKSFLDMSNSHMSRLPRRRLMWVLRLCSNTQIILS